MTVNYYLPDAQVYHFEMSSQHVFHKERGALYPQILLTFTMCIGALSFGHILNWGEAALDHMEDLTFVEEKHADDYAWVTCAGPLATAVGIAVWGFLTRRIGPRKTLLWQTPFMLLSWFLMFYSKTYKIYYAAHFIGAFCSASYLYAGEIYIIECVHRNNIKIFFVLFRSSVILGVLSMNFISTFLDKHWLCIICGNIAIICFALTVALPDPPLYLIVKSEIKAENSLKYYLGKNTVGPEMNTVRQHINFLNFGSYSNKHMLSSKVVLKAIIILTVLQFFKTCTGYYAFILDSVRIFESANDIINPYGDNIIFGIVLYITKLIGCFAHIYGNFGVKKPMMISMLFCSVVLFALGTVDFVSIEMKYVPMAGTNLLIFSIFAITYNMGMNMCPDITLYEYLPYQIYDFLNKIMIIVNWIMIFIVTRTYMKFITQWRLYVTLWILTAVTMIGFIFILVFVVDTKGKSLMNIQMELGGNPVGTRGSTRQRLANPFESLEEMYYLEKLIAADLARTTDKLPSNSITK